ncbi:major facilitator superfamily MFS_1 [Clostridium sp. CAG:277]|nr:major facilitator superfamily MFS_1 [Clostridium sp. CAG:277]
MNIRNDFRHTIAASYIGYITQAIVNNFAPLLFVTFHRTYGISLSRIGLLVTVNFVTQILVDLFSAKFTDRIGYRPNAVLAHIFAAVGLILLGILPELTSDPYLGISIAVVIYAIGGGLTEVIISPIVEACPTDKKGAAMSLLHSFYCWGSVLVVLVSTLLFRLLGLDSWRIISAMWAVIPACNAIYFCFVPINSLADEGRGMSITGLLKKKVFWVLALLMLCSGASELAMSQWASALAETGLHVSKTAGDLAGPCFFAILMGSGRVLHAHVAERFSLTGYLGACACLCIVSYLVVTFSPLPAISLAACGVCGLSVAAMWPGTFSISSKVCPQGGTTIFALLALAGDIGCSAGPATVGFVSSALQDNLKLGLLSAIIFPVLMIAGLTMCRKYEK